MKRIKRMIREIDTCHLCDHIKYDKEGEANCWYWVEFAPIEEEIEEHIIPLGNEFDKLEIPQCCPLEGLK